MVVVSTFQLDLECGLEAKASIKTDLLWEQNATFKFSMRYDKGAGRTTYEGPTFDARKTFQVQVTGGGSVSVSCGLIPRVNVLMYDSVGLFAGMRASLVARASYESQCKPNPTEFRPTGQVTLGLYGNVGLQIGARLQAPGSSFAGAKGASAGYDFGPLEPWNKEFPLLEKQWDFAKGLGYCTPLCKNGAKDGDETDVDCGGSCGKCQLRQGCKRNSDCANAACNQGRCSEDKCGDTVQDGQETDVDCGGPVSLCAPRCAAGKACFVGSDCGSGFCAGSGTANPYRCATDHCTDGVRDADEGGIDCSGRDCAKCANGVKAQAATDCASGLWNGVSCVAAHCTDSIKSGDETGLDCGGPSCAVRCGFMLGCQTSADCAAAAPVCDATRKLCLRGTGMACQSNADCGAGTCMGGICTKPPWTAQTSGTFETLFSVWGANATNIWTVGFGGTVLRWNGTAWVTQASGTTAYLTKVWGADVNNVWVVGQSGIIRKWNGTTWAAQTSGTTNFLYGIGGTDANNAWAVGVSGTILRWNGTAWSAQVSGTTQSLYAVWAADVNNVWAVGDTGTIRKWNGTAWAAQSSGTAENLIAIWGTDANNVWAVGTGGVILKWNGTAWAAQNSGVTDSLASISGVNASNIWAVGTKGLILKWNGANWTQENSGSTQELNGVWAADQNNVWAAGLGGTILKSP